MSSTKTRLFLLSIIIILVAVGSYEDGVGAYPNPNHSPATPYMLKDIEPSGDSNPRLFTALGHQVYFNASTEENGGYELWITNGTFAGTHLVRDIDPLPGGSTGPEDKTAFQNMLYFSANDNTHGYEVWKSDGTEKGTTMLKDICTYEYVPGLTASSEPFGFVEMQGELYFVAYDCTVSPFVLGLWKTDGTEIGTQRISNVPAGSAPVLVGDNMLYYTADAKLWKSDGTEEGTVAVRNTSYAETLTAVGNILFFVDRDASAGTELWKSNGTEEGTVRVADIMPGTDSSYPAQLTMMNDILYFRADDGTHGYELWRSDGTESGTFMVKDIYPDAGSGIPYPILPGGGFDWPIMNDEFYIYGFDPEHGNELWKSDGTETGTVLVKDIYPGTESSTPLWLTTNGTTLYFTANDGIHGMELWQSDGSEAGTLFVDDIYPGNNSTGPSYLSVQNGWLLFRANDGVHGEELWILPLTPSYHETQFLPLIMQPQAGKIGNGRYHEADGRCPASVPMLHSLTLWKK